MSIIPEAQTIQTNKQKRLGRLRQKYTPLWYRYFKFLIFNPVTFATIFCQQIDDHGPFNDLEVLKNKPGKISQS